jgi:hypothetical protein
MNGSDTENKTGQGQAEGHEIMRAGISEDNKDPTDDSTDDEKALEYFPVSEGKLITLYILSFGLYGVYWFYKNWTLQQPRMEKKIFPVMRAIFSIFFTHSLFKRINRSAEHLEKKHKFNANLMATLFVAAVVIGNVLDRVSVNFGILETLSDSTVIILSLIIFLLSAYPLAAVQATVNRINNDMLGYLNHKYSVWNYLLIASGSILWLMVLLGLLAESMGLVPAAAQ